jgi:hypothetical protein
MSTSPITNDEAAVARRAVRSDELADQARSLIQPHLAEVVGKLVSLAIAGDPRSAALVMAYAPAARPDAERAAVPGLMSGTLEQRAQAVLEAVAKGEISTVAGDQLLRTLREYGQVVATTELVQRVEALEQRRVVKALSVGDDGVIQAEDLV